MQICVFYALGLFSEADAAISIETMEDLDPHTVFEERLRAAGIQYPPEQRDRAEGEGSNSAFSTDSLAGQLLTQLKSGKVRLPPQQLFAPRRGGASPVFRKVH
jgi:hypothetical protein